MRLRIAANLLSLWCAWVLWEHWTVFAVGVPSREVDAVSETQSLGECHRVIPDFIEMRENRFRDDFKEPNFAITKGHKVVAVMSGEQVVQEYVYECLPSSVSPYHVDR